MVFTRRVVASSSEPDTSGGEAERERDRNFDAAGLCVTSADALTCRQVEAIRNLRCDDALSVDDLDSEHRSGQQQAAGESDQRGLLTMH